MSDQPTPDQPTQEQLAAYSREISDELARDFGRYAMEAAQIRVQLRHAEQILAAITAERDQLLSERDALIAAQEANQQAARRDS